MARDGWTKKDTDEPAPAKPNADKSPQEGESLEEWKDRIGGGA